MTFYGIYTNGILIMGMIGAIAITIFAIKTSRDISKELEENKPQ